MIHSGIARDLIVVQLVPDIATDVPTDAPSIRRRIGEIVFNSSLVAEMQAITALRSLAGRSTGASNVLDVRMHRIGPPRAELFEQGSSFERSRGRTGCGKAIHVAPRREDRCARDAQYRQSFRRRA